MYNPSLVIPAGSTSGSLTFLIDPTADNEDEGNETITLIASAEGLTDGSAHITLADGTETPLPPEATPLAFAADTSVEDQEYTAGTEISAMELPAAVGGVGDIAYSVSDLPSGLSFDAATRTLSGTPDAATGGTEPLTYTLSPEVAEHQAAGRYLVAWDATNDNGQNLSAGVYFYRLQAGGEFHAVRKMLLLK